MSISSDAVKTWRHKTKLRIIEAMGGGCVCCGYNRCPAALALHHLDPNQKEISLAAVRANPKRWKLIVEELRKCVLVCHNCHSEIHSGSIILPENIASFNEDFLDYKKIEKDLKDDFDNCPVCDKLKPKFQKTCSLVCAAKRQYRVDWDSVNIVVELQTKSVVRLAEELGCSDAAIHKRMKKLGLKKVK